MDPDLDTAMQVHLQFGPESARPRIERLLELLPALSREHGHRLLDRCDEVARAAYELVERERQGERSREAVLAELAARFSGLAGETLGHAYSQAHYFWWRDNG